MSIYPVPVDSIEKVASAKLLGVILHKSLRFNEHVRYINATCAQRLYLLKRLRDQSIGLDMLYAAWGGFVTAELRGTINAVFRRAGEVSGKST